MPLHPFGRRLRPRAFYRYLKLAVRVLRGETLGDRHLLEYLSTRPVAAQALAEFASDMPQAALIDGSAESATRDWRAHFVAQLHGHGLEIGPLHRPLATRDGVRVDYVDRADAESLKRQFPTLADAIIPVDIVDDAERLATVADGRYDFVIASHVIEHMRNPIGAMCQWLRILKPGGLLYLVVPDKRRTFDRRRVRTTLEHMMLDYQEPSTVRDREHFLEYAVLVHGQSHDAALAEARRLEAEDYSIHFHVFLPCDVLGLVRWMNDRVVPIEIVQGPVLNPDPDPELVEFHIMLRKPVAA